MLLAILSLRNWSGNADIAEGFFFIYIEQFAVVYPSYNTV